MSNEQQVPVVCIICGGTDDQEALDEAIFVQTTICENCGEDDIEL